MFLPIAIADTWKMNSAQLSLMQKTNNVMDAVRCSSMFLLNWPSLFFSSLCFFHQWDLICDRKHLKAMTQSVYMAGLLVGSVAFSTLSDHFGRKIGVFLSIFFMVSINSLKWL